MFKSKLLKGFSLAELIIVVVILTILSGASYIGIQAVQRSMHNNKRLDDLIAIPNALEQYKQDHFGKYPDIREALNGNQNILCFDRNALYIHDCESPDAAFIQGFVDNELLGKQYLSEVPTDPATKSRYVYGRTIDGRYYQVAGIWDNGDGTYEARTVDNLDKGFHLPGIVRAYDGPDFVVQRERFLPYSPTPSVLTAALRNVDGTVEIAGKRCMEKQQNIPFG